MTVTTPAPAAPAAVPTDAELRVLGEEYVNLLELKADLEQRMGEIQDVFRALPFGAHMAGDHLKLSVQHNIRRDDAKFMSEYPYEAFPHLYKPAIDSAVVKREFAPADLEAFQIEGAPKIVASVIE